MIQKELQYKVYSKEIVLFTLSIVISCCGFFYLCYFPHHIWETVTGCATVWIVYIAYSQLSKSNVTSRADFIRRFAESFFKTHTRNIFMLIEQKALKYKNTDEDGKSYRFKIDDEKVRALNISKERQELINGRESYTAYEIDDWLLGPLSDIGFFVHNKLIDIEEANDHFGYYIREVYKNDEIKRYIDDNSESYKWLIWIAKELKKT